MEETTDEQRLRVKVGTQAKQIELLRKKVFALQEVLIRGNNVPVCDFDHSLADISPIVSREFGGAKSTVIAFGGLATRLGMPPTEFLKTFTDRNLNTLFVKDFYQCWYQRGLLGLSADIEGTVKVLQERIPKNQNDVYTIGTSAGGFAAILFGVLLGATKIIAFSPQTLVNENIFQKFKSLDSRLSDIEGGDYVDLQQLLEKTEYQSEIHIHYSQDYADDREAAERMENLKNVHLHAWPFDGHNVAGWLKREQKLDGILEETLEGTWAKIPKKKKKGFKFGLGWLTGKKPKRKGRKKNNPNHQAD